MHCPVCQTTLRTVRSGDLEIDVCPHCGGTFFDRGELRDTLDRVLTTGEVPDAPLELDRQAVSVRRLQEADRACPRCAVPMNKFNYCYDSNIILDRCGQCGGIWADRGEVLKCAQYRKGNPKLDRMGASVAENVRRRQAFEEACAQGDGLMHRVHWWGWGWGLVLPLRDDEPSERFPVVTLGLIAVNVLVFVALFFTVGYDRYSVSVGDDGFTLEEGGIQRVYETFGTVPSKAAKGEQLWSLVTSVFLHVGVWHLLGNMLFLWIFGDNVEDRFGLWGFLVFYLACGVSSDLAYVLFNLGSSVPVVGASGAVSGVMGAYFIFYPRASIYTLIYTTVTPIPAYVYIGIWVAFQVLYAVLYTTAGVSGGVAWFAHLGGFAAGLALALVWRRRRGALAARG